MDKQQQNKQDKKTEKKEQQINNSTKDKVESAKQYIEKKYSKLKIEENEKSVNWEKINEKLESYNLNSEQIDVLKQQIQHKESEILRKKRQKMSTKDYIPLTIIGKGAFGEVRVCRDKKTNQVVAIKKMKKQEMLQKNQISHVRAERDVLSNANTNWIVDLKCSFQDNNYLYLVMEYLAGGDLMTLLMKKDILSMEETKFYIAELILAVDSVHKMNYIHRDLKPDNVLIDNDGHIKLSDFGLCKNAEIKPMVVFGQKKNDDCSNLTFNKQNIFKRNRKLAFSTVGTPDYIAPEVFNQQGYNETVDWWSIGVILYEMLVGYPPFFSDDPQITCQKIVNWKKTFQIPAEANLNPVTIDLIRRLITDSNERLGINGVEEIKIHPFFQGVDWKRIRQKKAPNIPELNGDSDTSNFDKFPDDEPWVLNQKENEKVDRNNVMNFIGYTYKQDEENQRTNLIEALQNLEQNIKIIEQRKPHSPTASNRSNQTNNTYDSETKKYHFRINYNNLNISKNKFSNPTLQSSFQNQSNSNLLKSLQKNEQSVRNILQEKELLKDQLTTTRIQQNSFKIQSPRNNQYQISQKIPNSPTQINFQNQINKYIAKDSQKQLINQLNLKSKPDLQIGKTIVNFAQSPKNQVIFNAETKAQVSKFMFIKDNNPLNTSKNLDDSLQKSKNLNKTGQLGGTSTNNLFKKPFKMNPLFKR